MSRHLRTMRENGLVAEERDEFDSRVRIYRLSREPMDDLSAWLAQTEDLWANQLRAFKTHLQKTRK